MSNENFHINKFHVCLGIQKVFYYENKPIYGNYIDMLCVQKPTAFFPLRLGSRIGRPVLMMHVSQQKPIQFCSSRPLWKSQASNRMVIKHIEF